jgi:hypothetical protein
MRATLDLFFFSFPFVVVVVVADSVEQIGRYAVVKYTNYIITLISKLVFYAMTSITNKSNSIFLGESTKYHYL